MFHRLCVIVLASLLSCSAHSEDWYAAPDGDDGNDCLTVSTACKTAQAAVQKMPLGGQWLHLAPGFMMKPSTCRMGDKSRSPVRLLRSVHVQT